MLTKIKNQPLDLIIEPLGVVAVIVSFALPAFYYSDLPDTLPRHYNSDGLPDAYSGKGMIWVLPILGFCLYLIISLISNFPALINIPIKTTPENMDFYQKKYSRMIRIINVEMVLLFAFLTYFSIQIGLGNQTQLSNYFKPVSLLFFFGTPLVYIIPDLLKARKKI